MVLPGVWRQQQGESREIGRRLIDRNLFIAAEGQKTPNMVVIRGFLFWADTVSGGHGGLFNRG